MRSRPNSNPWDFTIDLKGLDLTGLHHLFGRERRTITVCHTSEREVCHPFRRIVGISDEGTALTETQI